MKKSLFIILTFSLLSSTLIPQDTKENAEFKLALNLYNDGLYDLAIEQFKKFIETYPNSEQSIEAQFYLGMAYFKLRRFNEARFTFQSFALARADHPKAIDAWWKVAECYVQMKNYKEAASAFERIKVFYPKSETAPRALMESAKYFQLVGDIENVKKVLRAIVQEYQGSEYVYQARFKLADIFLDEGNTERALSEYGKLLKEVDDKDLYAMTLLKIARINIISGNADEAVKILKRVISSSENIRKDIIAEAYLELGKIQSKFGKYPEAIENLKMSAELASDSKKVKQGSIINLANVYFTLRDYQSAIKYYNQLINLFSEDEIEPEIWFDIAITFEKIGNLKKANEFYLKIIRSEDVSIDKRQAIVNSARNFVSMKNYKSAIELYSQFIENYPDDPSVPEVIFKIAQLYEENLGDYGRAIFYYNELITKYPRSSYIDESIYHLGVCHQRRGEMDDAISAFKTLIEQYVCSELYENAIEHIGEIENYTPVSKIDYIVKLTELIGDLLDEKPRSQIAFKLANLYNFDLKDYRKAIRYYNLILSIESDSVPDSIVVEASYQRVKCSFYLYRHGRRIHPDTVRIYAQQFLEMRSEGISRYFDDVLFYLYQVEHELATSIEERGDIARDFLTSYPESKFAGRFIYDIINSLVQKGRWEEVIAMIDENFDKFDDVLKVEVLYKRALAYNKLGDKQRAISDLRLILGNYSPSRFDVKAMNLLADIYRELGNYGDAVQLYRNIIENYFYTDFAEEAVLRIADIYFDSGDYMKAISEYKSFIEGKRRSIFAGDYLNPEVIYRIAISYDRLGNKDEAKRFYRSYLTLGVPSSLPHTGEVYYSLANIYKLEGRNDEAIYYFEKASEFDKSFKNRAILEAAEIMFEGGRYEDALRKYMESLPLADTDSLRAYIQSRIIISYFRMNDIDGANKGINRFKESFSQVNIEDYLAEFELELGGYYFRNGNHSKALEIFNSIIQRYPGTRYAHLSSYWIAKVEESRNRVDKAFKILLDLISRPIEKELRLRVNFALGNLYFKFEKYDSATIYYRFVVETAEGIDRRLLRSAMSNLISSYEELKYYELALEVTKRYIEKFPNADDIIDKKIKIGILYQMLGYYDQALIYFRDLLEEADRDLEAELHYYIGEVLYYKGEYEEAILEFLKVPYLITRRTKIDWTANAFYMAGQSYEKMGKYEQAINMYQQIIDRPDIDPIFKAGAQKEIDRVRSIIKQN